MPPYVGGYKEAVRNGGPALLEIVDDDFFADRLENFFDEFDVGGVVLVVVLGFLIAKGDVEGDLVGLVDDRAAAFRHAPDMEMEDAGDGLEVFLGAGDKFFNGVGFVGLGPENDYVREHRRIERSHPRLRKPVLSRRSAGVPARSNVRTALTVLSRSRVRTSTRPVKSCIAAGEDARAPFSALTRSRIFDGITPLYEELSPEPPFQCEIEPLF